MAPAGTDTEPWTAVWYAATKRQTASSSSSPDDDDDDDQMTDGRAVRPEQAQIQSARWQRFQEQSVATVSVTVAATQRLSSDHQQEGPKKSRRDLQRAA